MLIPKQTLQKMNEKKQNKKMTFFDRLKRDCINFLNEFFRLDIYF